MVNRAQPRDTTTPHATRWWGMRAGGAIISLGAVADLALLTLLPPARPANPLYAQSMTPLV